MRKKVEIILTGTLKWNKFRDLIVKKLNNCKTERDFLKQMKVLYFSMSESEEEMQEKRRSLGILET